MNTRSLLLLSLLAPFPSDARAATAEERGLEIAREADRRDSGWVDSRSEMEMVLRNKHGQESIRRLRVKQLEVPADGDKGFTVFDEPADIKGTALLTFSHKTESDDQWLYLPALKRVKRIASADKSGAFMGSEFAFEDISSQEVEKYAYKHLRDEALGAQECFVIERYPASRYSGYTRQIAWIDKAEYRVLRVDYHDRKGSELKTLVFDGYRRYGRHWRPDSMLMTNLQTGKSTLLRWKNYAFGVSLPPSDFTQEALKRAR